MADPEEIKAIRADKNNQFIYRILGGILLVGFGVVIGFGIFQSQSDRTSYLINVFTSMLSIFTTVFVIDLLNRRREDRKSDSDLKEKLIIQMRSEDNALAIQAIERIKARGWHKDGSLRGQVFSSANLRSARLQEFDLRGCVFVNTQFQYAKIFGSDLSDSEFANANLKNADISNTKLNRSVFIAATLQNARIHSSDLAECSLLNTNLSGASLHESNLENVKYIDTIVEDNNTIMPDTTLFMRYNSEFNRFVDPNHKNFWRSETPLSPAYRGKKVN